MILFSSAKVNLTLDILGRRDDGYHPLRSVVHTVGVYDELHFSFGSPWGINCNVRDLESDDNLCLRAARLYLAATARSSAEHPVRISLYKSIPSGAGLGGGSSNAAATLRAMQLHFGDDIELTDLAAQLGADVPFFLNGGCAMMEGIGEKLTPLAPLAGWLVLVKPPEFGRTSDVYAAWDKAPVTTNATDAMLGTLQENDLRKVAGALGNDLREAAQQCGVESCGLESWLRELGALGAMMSGSGSAVFGIFENEAVARRASLELSRLAGELEVFVAPFCARGIEIAAPNVA